MAMCCGSNTGTCGGDAVSDRPDTSQMNLQPIAALFFGQGWSLGYSGTILASWKASFGNV